MVRLGKWCQTTPKQSHWHHVQSSRTTPSRSRVIVEKVLAEAATLRRRDSVAQRCLVVVGCEVWHEGEQSSGRLAGDYCQ